MALNKRTIPQKSLCPIIFFFGCSSFMHDYKILMWKFEVKPCYVSILLSLSYFLLFYNFLVRITIRLNQYLSSVTLSRFCWWSQLEIKRSQQSERRTPLRLSKEIVATTSFILYATSDRNQMKKKNGTHVPKLLFHLPSLHE